MTGIESFADSVPAPLNWGEIVPARLVVPPPMLASADFGIWSQPLRRYDDSPAMVPELLRVGELLRNHFDNAMASSNVLVIISADLAHTHKVPAGLEPGPYGDNGAAEPFDLAVSTWAKQPGTASGRQALKVMQHMQAEGASSCGFAGIVMLQGLMFPGNDTDTAWQTQVFANEHVGLERSDCGHPHADSRRRGCGSDPKRGPIEKKRTRHSQRHTLVRTRPSLRSSPPLPSHPQPTYYGMAVATFERKR